MKRLRVLITAGFVLLFASHVVADNELRLGDGLAKNGEIADIPLTLNTTDEVQGLVAVFEWSGPATGIDLIPGAALADADQVAMRVEDGFMVLGVVMNTDGTGDEIIPPGQDIDIATARIRCDGISAPFDLTFVDNKYALVTNGALLDNVVVVGGLSIDVSTGLTLTNGSLECVEGFNRLYFDGPIEGLCGDARVMMENLAPVEGYVVAVCHDPAVLELRSVAAGSAALSNNADFIADDIFPNGGYVAVVLDLQEPFDGNTIPPGPANHAATFSYCCVTPPPAGQSVDTTLELCDDVIGSPTLENTMVIAGLSLSADQGLVLEDGTFTCKSEPREICDNEIDDDLNGLTDCDDPACEDLAICTQIDCDKFPDDPRCQQAFACGTPNPGGAGSPIDVEASVGTATEVCFFLRSPEDNQPGGPQFDHIQGFSMTLTFCCDLTAGTEFKIDGTILDALGAEFIDLQSDNDNGDGDGCELVIGVLIDALPPFDGRTIPPMDDFQKVGAVDFQVANNDALCGSSCEIKFTDEINGTGIIPMRNLISVENMSSKPLLFGCNVNIVGKERFFRGDCNFSRMLEGMAVDIADAAAVISLLFSPGTWKFQPPCLDACDCNDDGRLDLADATCVLYYLFRGGRVPPPPGPGLKITDDGIEFTGPGVDPSPDNLDCAAGNGCASNLP